MKNRVVKRVHLFFSSLFIFLLHLPFVFAKVRPAVCQSSVKPVIISNVPGCSSFEKEEERTCMGSNLYDSLKLASSGLTKQVFDYALKGFAYLKAAGKIDNAGIISIADFSKSSCKKRFFVIDLDHCKVLFNTYVAHGMNSGQEFARYFSNIPESNKSSLGFYETAGTYNGKNGYSLHLVGLERGINDNAYSRDIVMHGAGYVSEELIHAQGFLGRSQGCPALPEKLHKKIIDKIKNGTCLFIYGQDKHYFNHSAIIKNSAAPLLAVK